MLGTYHGPSEDKRTLNNQEYTLGCIDTKPRKRLFEVGLNLDPVSEPRVKVDFPARILQPSSAKHLYESLRVVVVINPQATESSFNHRIAGPVSGAYNPP